MSEAIVDKLLSDARAVASYVIDNGITLPAGVIETLDGAPARTSDGEVDVARVVAAYNTLAQLIAPATPRDIVVLVESGTDRLAASRRLMVQMLFIAAGSLTGFVALSLSSYVNDPQYGDIFAASGFPLLVNELFYLFAAGLGASFWILMESHTELRNTELTATQRASKWIQFLTSSQIWLRFILGLISGLILATIIDHSSGTGSPDAVTHATGRYTAAAMALIGGFGARSVFNLLYRIALAVEGLVGDQGSLPLRQSAAPPSTPQVVTVEAAPAPAPIKPEPAPIKPEPAPKAEPAPKPEPAPRIDQSAPPADKTALPKAAKKSGLDKAQLAAATRFNRKQPYTKALWRQIQNNVSAGVDGDPGNNTAECIGVFQRAGALDVDGCCGAGTLAAIGVSPIRALDDKAFFFAGGLSIDADGAPNAYNPKNTGIDYLGNAGKPGNWWGLATNGKGEPYVQGKGDPHPGFYVSTTALADSSFRGNDPRRYVDSTAIPYIVLPANVQALIPTPKVRKGDLAVVFRKNAPDELVYAIYADVGPRKQLDPQKRFGEGSIALAQALGHDPYVKRNGITRASRGIGSGLVYVVFPGSGDRKPLPTGDIATRGAAALTAWGGRARLDDVLAALA